MAWELEGVYVENCNCDAICPCTWSNLARGATYDDCRATLGFRIEHVPTPDSDTPFELFLARPREVRQLRLVVEAEDFDEAVVFYRDVLGLPVEFAGRDGDAQVVAIRAGRATLELVNPAQRKLIDQLEVGHEVSRKFRVAFEVDDSAAATDRLVAAGAELLAPPTRTPWGSLNARLEGPAGLQLTLFQELGSAD